MVGAAGFEPTTSTVFRERWSKRELERQFKAALFERPVLSPPKVSPVVTQMYPDALSVFRDAYTVEFLGLPPIPAEADLHRALLDKLKDFLIELGRDFCFVGSEYPCRLEVEILLSICCSFIGD